MAVGKRLAAAVDCQAQAKPAKKRRIVVAKRTTPSTIKKPAAFASTADYEEETSSLGEGAFGVVYKARHRATGQTVAIKYQVFADADPRELLREARFLEACNGDPQVVGFRCVVRDPDTGELGLVTEFVPGQSLHTILFQRRRAAAPPLPEATVRAFMRQLLTGAKGMQDRNIVHRDIKPENVMVADGGEVLKICDFGLAISASDPPPGNQAGTKSYTASEVLMGKRDHDALEDAWSLGCVMAELVGGQKLLQRGGLMEALIDMEICDEEIAYLWTIFKVLGTPDDVTWPGFASLPRAATMPLKPGQRSRLREMFPEETLSEEGFEVLNGLLTCNPEKRLTAADALKLPWFAPPPPPPPPPKTESPLRSPAAADADADEKLAIVTSNQLPGKEKLMTLSPVVTKEELRTIIAPADRRHGRSSQLV